MLNKYRPVAAALLVLGAAGIAQAKVVVLHGKVLSTNTSTKVFRLLVQETGKERNFYTNSKTTYKFANGKAATFADIKAGKTVEVKAEERKTEGYDAAAVSIRL